MERDGATTMMSHALVDEFGMHRSMLFGIARRYVGDDAAADVIQNVFVRVWANPWRFDADRGQFRQYLCTVTRGMSIDFVRHHAAQRSRDHDDVVIGDEGLDVAMQQLINGETSAQVHLALQTISSEERAAVMAAFFRRLTYRQVAEELDIPEGTAKSRIRSGLKNLRRELVRSDPTTAEVSQKRIPATSSPNPVAG